ncbi:hypothetical protein ACVU7I_03595 [Patulibacter sp. S7RM1-6]
MPALRLTFLVALVVGVLAVVAASTSMTRNPGEDPLGRTTTTAPAPTGAAARSQVVDAKAPADEPIRAHVGDLVQLTVTLDEADAVVLDAFGVHENVGAGVPMLVPIVALRAGTFRVRTQLGGERVATLVVSPPRAAADDGNDGGDGSGGTRPQQPGNDAPILTRHEVVAL